MLNKINYILLYRVSVEYFDHFYRIIGIEETKGIVRREGLQITGLDWRMSKFFFFLLFSKFLLTFLDHPAVPNFVQHKSEKFSTLPNKTYFIVVNKTVLKLKFCSFF